MSSVPCKARLPFLSSDIPPQLTAPVNLARFQWVQALPDTPPALRWSRPGRGLAIAREGKGWRVSGGDTGVLYGAYHLLMALMAGEAPRESAAPFYALRMLNCWDNASGEVERGYGGRSLFFEGGRLDYGPGRCGSWGGCWPSWA